MKSTRYALVAILLPTVLCLGCESIFGTAPRDPGKIEDLSVISTGPSSITVRWTQIDDGSSRAANYSVVVGREAFQFDSVRESAAVVVGTAIDSGITYVIDNLERGTEYRFQVAAFRIAETGERIYGTPSRVLTATTDVDPPEVVDDLRVSSISQNSAIIEWTQVGNGAGGAANYRVAFGTATPSWPTTFTSANVVPGTSVGASRTFTVASLSPATTYLFQVESVLGNALDVANRGSRSNVATGTTPAPEAGGPTPFFSDNFDNGQRTNANGFTWSNTGSRVTVSSTQVFSGTHSMALRFGPDSVGKDSNAEGRFLLGRNLTEIWLEYFLFVPSNYVHRNESPNNNKFFRIWGDSYSSSNKVGASTSFSAGGTSTLMFEYNYKTWADGTLGFGPSSVAGARSPSTAFGGESFRGRWTRVRIYAKQVSGTDADDAALRLWFGDTLVLNFSNIPQKFDPLRPYWNAGYLLGWSNSGFTDETVFYIDDVKFFSTNPGW